MRKLNPSTVIATIALIAALTGGAYAAGRIGTDDLKDGAVTKSKLAKKAVSGKKIVNGAIGTGKLQGGSVTGAKLASGSVGPDSIKGGSITQSKIADDAVTGDALARIVQHSVQEGVENGQVASVTASCNSGEVLISGGGGWVGNAAGLILRFSEPTTNSDGWTVSGQNASGGIKQLSATALCLGDDPDEG